MDMTRNAATETVLRGGSVLLPGEGLRPCDVVVEGDQIIEVVEGADYVGAKVVDAGGCLILPGIVDIHGDAFERQIMPRPKTMFPLDIAMQETDRQLAANGITTAFHGITISWEPGLRSLTESERVIAAIDAAEPDFLVDNRLHIRWETFAVDEVPAMVCLMHREKRPILAFNDHTTPTLSGTRLQSKLGKSAERALVDVETYHALLNAQAERGSEVHSAIEVVARVAEELDVPMLSHDDMSVEIRQYFRALGVKLSEFPLNWETVEEAAAHGDDIVMGAPNVVRGGSHNGAISAEEAFRRGQCTILASDYYYPAPLHAAFQLTAAGVTSLERAWELVSGAPARATRLTDRGAIVPGKRADLIVVRKGGVRPILTMSGGRIVYQSL